MPETSGSGIPREFVVLIVAAGRSERFGGEKKELRPLGGRSVVDRAVSPFLGLPGLALLCIAGPAGGLESLREALAPETRALLGERLRIVPGGTSRRDSVRLGLSALAEGPHSGDLIVLVHDGARPWASPDLVRRVLDGVERFGAIVPLLPLVETPKAITADGVVLDHPPRSSLAAAQTPQGFRLDPLLEAHRRAEAAGLACTDDAELWARYVGPVHWVEGERENRKITFREDLMVNPGHSSPDPRAPRAETLRVGEGWDLHRLVPARPLLVGGVHIPWELGEEAHSDGDVLLHALIDALLGGAGLGDIGTQFPPSEERWRGVDSRDLLARALGLVREAGWEPGNVDCTVVLERPTLGAYKPRIRAELARILGLPESRVAVKAKTCEGLGPVGEGRAIEARAVVLLSGIPVP